jgi:LysM repeat protein
MKRHILIITVMALLTLATLPLNAQQSEETHVVRRGETLRDIAALYGVTWRDIAAANNLANPNLIFAGQELVIPTPGTNPIINQPTRVYVVQRGDTVRDIAFRNATTVEAIAEVNNLANPSVILPGQELTLPAVGGPVANTPATTPVETPVRTIRAGGRYIVQPGDTLYEIGAAFNRDIYNIARLNNILNLNRIYSGQVLLIPGY